MKRHSPSKVILATALVTLSFLAGCGSGKGTQDEPVTLSNAPNPPPEGIQPDIHTDLPPPTNTSDTSKNAVDPNTAENFFAGKKAYDNFSDPLKERIYQTYSADAASNLGGNSHGYYNTLLGRTSPLPYNTQASAVAGQPGVLTATSSSSSGSIVSAAAPTVSSAVAGCDPSATFLCLDSPQNDFETVQPGVDVIGKIDLRQLAVFGATDPVVVISVFNNTGGGATTEIPILPGDVQTTSDPNIGKFQAAAGLTGGGRFTIVVSAFKTINGGAGNELFSIMVNGTRDEAPTIQFVSAVPAPLNKLAAAGHEKDPVQNNAVIASDFLNVKVKLLTAGGSGIQVKFDDRNENDELQSSVVALPSAEGADTFFTGVVPLHQGVNKIEVSASSPALDRLLGDQAPPPSVVGIAVFNADGGPRIKVMKPAKDGIVAQTAASGQTVELQFCYTFVPGQVTGNAGGSGTSSLPSLTDACKTGQLGFTPDVFINGVKVVGTDKINYDATQGIFTVTVEPGFGINIYEIRSVDQINAGNDQTKSTSYAAGAFAFGNPMKLIENGQIATANTMTDRGLNIDIDEHMVEGDVQKMLVKFLNRPETSNLVLGLFKKTANAPGYPCREVDPPTTSSGDTTINFLADSFKLGPVDPNDQTPAIEVTSLKDGNDGMLHVGLRINGMHGDADLRAAESNGNTFNGKDLGFIPVRFSIARLDINVGVAFAQKHDLDLNGDGVGNAEDHRQLLDLRRLRDVQLIDITGDGPLGRSIFVDSSRNPLAAGLELLDWQQGLLLTQFNNILNGTLLCGVEDGVNNTTSGALGKAIVDLEKLTGYNANIFRLPLNRSLLGKTLSLDVAYDILRAQAISFDPQGIHIVNAPLRFNPGPSVLTQLATGVADGIVGSVSRWMDAAEAQPQRGATTEDHTLALDLGEDALNQIFAAASQSGFLDLDIDANFYSTNGITPPKALAPEGGNDSRLANDIDANLDGKKDDLDKQVPLLLRIRTDKRVSPMMTFLTADEVKALAAVVTPKTTTGQNASTVDPDGRYFRLMVPNLELDVYRTAPIPEGEGGTKTFCEVNVPTQYNATLAAKGVCQVQPTTTTLTPIESMPSGQSCPPANLVKLPNRNGAIVSYEDVTSQNFDNPKPLYRIKGNLMVHGQIVGVKRLVPAKDHLTGANPPEKTLLQIRIVPNTLSDSNPVFLTSIQVLENNTNKSDSALASDWVTTLSGALGSPCERFNELLIPVPQKLPGDPAAGSPPPAPLLPTFGVDYLDLGTVDPNDVTTTGHIPAAYIDDSRLYLDILAYAALHFSDT